MSHSIYNIWLHGKDIGLNVFTVKGLETKHLFLDAAKCKTISERTFSLLTSIIRDNLKISNIETGLFSSDKSTQ